jgi:hypothetical protein
MQEPMFHLPLHIMQATDKSSLQPVTLLNVWCDTFATRLFIITIIFINRFLSLKDLSSTQSKTDALSSIITLFCARGIMEVEKSLRCTCF